MATFQVEISGKGLRVETIQKLVDLFRDKYGDKASTAIRKVEVPESRSDRFSEAVGKIEEARDQMQELCDELEEWKDSLPENLQSGSKADELDSAIQELEDAISNANCAAECEVTFPAMM